MGQAHYELCPSRLRGDFFQRPRQQVFNILHGVSLRQCREHLAQVVIRLQSIRLRCFDEGIQVGAGFDSANRIAKNPIFPVMDTFP
jgi:hypothetical protein